MKILFVLHDTSFSGATITLLRYISWLKSTTICETHFLLPYSSDYDNYYENLGKVYYWSIPERTIPNLLIKIFYKIKGKFFKSIDWKQKLVTIFLKEDYDLIYGNTIIVESTLQDLMHLNKPIIWHIHENKLSVKIYNENGLESYRIANKIIVTSLYTYNYLVNDLNIPDTQIKIHPPPLAKKSSQQNIYEVPEKCFVIGSTGTNLIQKGMSIFVMLSKILETKIDNNNFFYVWIGSELNEPNIQFDLEQTRLISKFYFTGLIPNPYDYYRKIDLFISCSREESFGLSMAECASLNIPFLCFPTNGLLQYFENKQDFSVDYLDLNEMADRIIDLYKNKSKRTSLGMIAGEVCKKFEIDYLGDAWVTTLKNATK